MKTIKCILACSLISTSIISFAQSNHDEAISSNISSEKIGQLTPQNIESKQITNELPHPNPTPHKIQKFINEGRMAKVSRIKQWGTAFILGPQNWKTPGSPDKFETVLTAVTNYHVLTFEETERNATPIVNLFPSGFGYYSGDPEVFSSFRLMVDSPKSNAENRFMPTVYIITKYRCARHLDICILGLKRILHHDSTELPDSYTQYVHSDDVKLSQTAYFAGIIDHTSAVTVKAGLVDSHFSLKVTTPDAKSKVMVNTSQKRLLTKSMSGGPVFDDEGRLLGIISFFNEKYNINGFLPSEWIFHLIEGETFANEIADEIPFYASHSSPFFPDALNQYILEAQKKFGN